MNWKKEVYVGFFLIFVSIFLLIMTLSMNATDAYYIRICLGMLILLSIFLIIKNQKLNKEDVDKSKKNLFLTSKQILVIIFTILYVVMYYIIGFFASTLLFIFVCAFYLGYKKIPRLIFITLLITGGIYYIFFVYLKLYEISGFLFN